MANAIPQTMPQVSVGSGKYDSYKASSGDQRFQEMMKQTASAEEENGIMEYSPQIRKKDQTDYHVPSTESEEEKIVDISLLALCDMTLLQEIPNTQPEIQEAIDVTKANEVIFPEIQLTATDTQPQTLVQTTELPVSTEANIKATQIAETWKPENLHKQLAEGRDPVMVPSPVSEALPKIEVTNISESRTGEESQPEAGNKNPEPSAAAVKGESAEVIQVRKEEVVLEKEEPEVTEPTAERVAELPLKETQVVRIKVAEPFRPVDQTLMNQVSNTVKETVAAGKQEIVIQLDPEHLGKIAIKITMMDEGIKVVLNCDSLKTQNLLAEKAATIGSIVEQNMNSPVSVEVKDNGYWDQQKESGDQHANQQERQEHQKRQSRDDTDEFLQQLRLGLTPQLIAV